ncbi:hypothetical protein D6D03_09225 [Aureobasidium pullulans]|nr:hypothetical protein D6D03_09225 [Aureobasidium pullulans]
MDLQATLAQLTLEEKVSLLSGADFWHTRSIPRLNIPSLRLSDGPNGVRGTKFFDGVPAACLPCGTALGATWNRELLEDAGHLIAEECKAKSAHVWLGPTVNVQRSPLGGRGFESYSEDPLLSGLLAAAIVRGVQDSGIASTIKHFVANDMEHERKAVDCVVSERALHEIYLLPFQIVVRDASPMAFMTSYNKLNGCHVSEHRNLLQQMLREEWGWRGLITSDWYGTYSTTEAVNAGLDLEMPGPTEWRGLILANSIRAGKISMKTLDARVGAVLRLVDQVSKSDIPERGPERTNDKKETSEKLRNLSAEGLVLLKNEGSTLPLDTAKTVAIIGPNAKILRFCGGGSAALRPYNSKTIYDAMLEVNTNTKYAVGCETHAQLPSLSPLLRLPGGKSGFFSFKVYLEPSEDPHRVPIDSIELDDTNILLIDYQHPKVKNDMLYATMTAELCPDESGEYLFGLTVAGTARLYIDDELLIDNFTVQKPGDSFFGSGTVEERGRLTLEAGKTYKWRVEFGSAPTSKTKQNGVTMFGPGGVRIGCTRIIDAEEEIHKAIAVAREVDQVVLCCGLSGDWESEGFDRPNMHLPGLQNRLVEEVCKVNSRAIVVLQSGTPVTTPWADQAPAILQAWYGGNKTASAIVDMLFGKSCPSGKLPLSWPKRNGDNPAFLNYRSDEGRCLCGEDIYVGYRYYEKVGCGVQWPFGFGLSYAEFQLLGQQIKHEDVDGLGETISVTVQVKNISTKFDGAEVVQLYVSPPKSGIGRPLKELKAFSKVFVRCGEIVTAKVSVSLRYATSYWSEREEAWVSQKGMYKILIGTSSDNTPLEATFETKSTFSWNGV